MKIVIFGLSITSSWGNGHATTYRALVRGLASRGHDVLFAEREVPWYAENRDLPQPPYCRTRIYDGVGAVDGELGEEVAAADLVVVGSYVPDGVEVIDAVLRRARGCTAFYDIDTPVTLAALGGGETAYLQRRQVSRFDLYLSFTGGPTLTRLEREFDARRARALYCSVDPEHYYPDPVVGPDRDLGYLGTYSADRQPTLTRLLLDPARAWPDGRFVIAGPQYPPTMAQAPNVERITHLAPGEHRPFYNRLRFTLNVTRRDMVEAGYSPSVRLFEAGACGTPIISDAWPGLETILEPGRDILLAHDAGDVLTYLRELSDEERRAVGARARERVLQAHTAVHRAIELEEYVREAGGNRAPEADRTVARIA